jgi:hypothetical protein
MNFTCPLMIGEDRASYQVVSSDDHVEITSLRNDHPVWIEVIPTLKLRLSITVLSPSTSSAGVAKVSLGGDRAITIEASRVDDLLRLLFPKLMRSEATLPGA